MSDSTKVKRPVNEFTEKKLLYLMRDAASAKPQIFITGDGWFTYNLVTNLAQI